ncbi:MAG: hypothetical protein ACYC21_12965 [Eubacteriales bacterium]
MSLFSTKKTDKIDEEEDLFDEHNNFTDKEAPKLPSLLFVFGGVICYLLKIAITFSLTSKSSPWLTTLDSALQNLGNILITVAIGSTVLNYYGFIKHMRDRIKEVIVGHDYIETMSSKKKKSLIDRLEKALFFKDIPDLGDNSLFDTVKTQVQPLLTEYYIKEYIVTVDCKVEKDHIIKKVLKEIEYANLIPDKEVEIDFTPLDADFKVIDQQEEDLEKIKKHYQLKRFKFGSEDYTEKVNVVYEKKKDDGINKDTYDWSARCDMNSIGKLLFKNSVTLKIETESIVPRDDVHLIHRVPRPCKNYCIHFNYNSDECYVVGEGFGFMDVSPHSNVEYRRNKNGLVIRFKSWILPGDGVIFTILDK